MPFSLGQQMTRTACIFQGVIALPAMLVMGGTALQSLFTLEMPIYDFILATFLGLFASGIIFIVWVQHNVETSRNSTLYLEIVKSGLATAGWLWLLLDCIIGPDHYSYYDPPPRGPRIQRAAISVILLFILYYPTLVWAIVDENSHDQQGVEPGMEEEAVGERQPLLGQ